MRTRNRGFRAEIFRRRLRYYAQTEFPPGWSHQQIESRAKPLQSVPRSPKCQAPANTTPVPPSPRGTSDDSRNVHQPCADRIDHEFRGLMNSQRVHDVRAMNSDGICAKFKCRRDLLVRLTVDD